MGLINYAELPKLRKIYFVPEELAGRVASEELPVDEHGDCHAYLMACLTKYVTDELDLTVGEVLDEARIAELIDHAADVAACMMLHQAEAEASKQHR